MTVLDSFHAQLEDYIDFDFLDQLSAPKLKKDGNYYGTYVAEIQQKYAVFAPDQCSIVLKEISPSLCEIYRKISTIYSPYIETVYGVLSENGAGLAFNEFIRKPSRLDYPTRELAESRSLTLENFILRIRKFSEKESLVFLWQLCDALEVISDLHLVHGDVSPQNILLTDRLTLKDARDKNSVISPAVHSHSAGLFHQISVKLIDFDIAREEKGAHHLVTTVAGTNPYAAPEILDYQTPTDRVDIYSLGCVLAFMLTGKSPKQMSREELQVSCRKPIRKIIAKCTSDYSHRYSTVAHLKKDISALLSTFSIPVSDFFHIHPGNHTGKPTDSKIAEIVTRQQILEAIKNPSRSPEADSVIYSSQYGQNILHICYVAAHRQNKSHRQNKCRKKFILACAFATLTVFLSLAAAGRLRMSSTSSADSGNSSISDSDTADSGNSAISGSDTADSGSTSDDDFELPQTTVLRAEAAMDEGDYDSAEEILDSEKEKNTNTFAGSLTYSELYNAQGRYDEAALVVLNFIDHYYPTVNMHPNAPLYQQLKNITGTLSPEVQTRYDKCITECEESGEVYDSIYALIQADRFQAALELCNTRKKAGAFDSALFEYYNDCYMGLKKYEEFADYLIELIENYPPDDSPAQLEVPFKSWVISCMEEIYPNLSAETQQRMDDLHVFDTSDNSDADNEDADNEDSDNPDTSNTDINNTEKQ